ncbi:MAG TPA: adenylate/guanylate cyclase domain-containing protein [Kiloniellales bacterium]|jgi:class 3 adenylate cyclase
MNPNTCTICELMFKRVMKARKVSVNATILFADLRGYTALSQTLPEEQVSELLDAFYDECASAIWANDGLLNKTIGDAVMAVFNFPIRHDGHAANALLAARQIQQQFGLRAASIAAGSENVGAVVGIGIGIDSGMVSFGEFGRSHRDLTAIGNVVNLAARAQSVAERGQILVTQSVRNQTNAATDQAPARSYDLKGIDQPVLLFSA